VGTVGDRNAPSPGPRRRGTARTGSDDVKGTPVSWDVLVIPLPEDAASTDDLPDDYTPPPVGPLEEVLARLRRAVPDVDLADPTWGLLAGPSWSMELGIGSEDPVRSVMLHVHGSGDDVVAVALRIAGALGCRALDCSSGAFLTGAEDTGGWHRFQAYRDRVLGQG